MGGKTIAELLVRIQGLPSIIAFVEVLRFSMRRESSRHHNVWKTDNPALGQDLVAALLMQERYGGQIMRAVIWATDTKSIEYYWNRFGDADVHVADHQFEPEVSTFVRQQRGVPVSREELLEVDGDGKMEYRYGIFTDVVEWVENSLKRLRAEVSVQHAPSSA